jgi:hypothetical protein
MKRFIVATALTVAVGLGVSGRANAQAVFFSSPNGTRAVNNNSGVMPGGFRNFSSPSNGVMFQPTFGSTVQTNPFLFSNGFNTFSSPSQPTFYGPSPGLFQPAFGTFQPAIGTFQPNLFVVQNPNSTFFRPNTVVTPVGRINNVPFRRR